jgi:hypothetical protein
MVVYMPLEYGMLFHAIHAAGPAVQAYSDWNKVFLLSYAAPEPLSATGLRGGEHIPVGIA